MITDNEMIFLLRGVLIGMAFMVFIVTFIFHLKKRTAMSGGGYQPTKGNLDPNNPPQGGTGIAPMSEKFFDSDGKRRPGMGGLII